MDETSLSRSSDGCFSYSSMLMRSFTAPRIRCLQPRYFRLSARMHVRLAQRAATFLNAQGRRAEAEQVYMQLREAARARQDSEVVENCTWELSWIQAKTARFCHHALRALSFPSIFSNPT
jgi:hypothetical protein